MSEEFKPRLLWVGDSPTVDTGFGRVTANVLDFLKDHWDVHVLGINSTGGPHKYPFPIYPSRMRGDLWGLGFFQELLRDLRPHAVCILQDPWIVSRFLEMDHGDIPVAAYIPVDATNQPPAACRVLNRLDLAIFYTRFGERECRRAGYNGASEVIPHGVDAKLYRPIDRSEARRRLQFSGIVPEDAFIIGNVNRNQPRKRLDLCIMWFAEWVRRVAGSVQKLPNAYLYLHCAQRDAMGIDLGELAWHYGIADRLIVPDESVVRPDKGLPEEVMPFVYSSFDVQVSTTLGEGWGLCQAEGSACGVPQIVPISSGQGEWMSGAAWMLHCPERAVHVGINTVGAVPSKDDFIRALDLFYHNPELRSEYAARALARVREPRFRWPAIGERFHHALYQMMVEKKKKTVSEKSETVDHVKVQETESVQAVAAGAV